MSTDLASGFPRALTSFIGRRDDIDRLSGLLAAHRLVTVTGPGGVGKTRLAAEVTRQLAQQSGDPVRLVELAPVHDPALVPAAVAAILGVQQRADSTLVQATGEVLARERALLVLDNCEHVAAAAAQLCEGLLSLGDDVRILATSREPLRVPGEARLRLAPLAVDGANDSGTGWADGVALFLDRVLLVDPAFEVTPESARLAAQIATRLDGLPLAIELAAARYESLGAAQLLARLAEPLTVLTGGARSGPRRHRSLHDTVEWSYRLLDEQQREAFRRVAVLPGPFTLAVAEAVGACESALLDLVDFSLLAPPAPGSDGAARYVMLQSLRAFAMEQLVEAGEQVDAEAEMCGYYVAATARAASGIRTSGGESAAVRWFDAEDPMVHHALAWALDNNAAGALRLATALAGWWQLRDRALRGYRLLHRALDGYPERDAEWFAAQMWLGRLAQSTAQFPAALTHFTTVCESLGSGAPSNALVDGLGGRSGTLRNLVRLPEATETAARALALARQLDYAEGEAFALTQLSLAADYAGDHGAAMRYAVEAGRIDRSAMPDRLARRVALVLTIAQTDSGDIPSARQTCAEGLRSARLVGDIHSQADFIYLTTQIALSTGDFADASAGIREAMRLATLSGDRLRLLGCLEDCARLCAATGRPADAVTLWAARETQAAALTIPQLPREISDWSKPAGAAAHRLGEQRTSEARHRGVAMTLTAAAEFADMLVRPDPDPTNPPIGSSRLTPRERELVLLVAQGRTDAQIAGEMFISIRTVRSHLDRIRDKTGSRRRADLTRLALREGLV